MVKLFDFQFTEFEIKGLKGNQLPPPRTAYLEQFDKCGLINLCKVKTLDNSPRTTCLEQFKKCGFGYPCKVMESAPSS